MDLAMKKIIMVDDVFYHLISMKEQLKRRYDVYTAQSQEALFELFENVLPDLILLDIQMPDMNGFEIIKMLKADENYKDIPVIFFTGKDDKHSALKGMELGAVDFITKPIVTAALIEVIEIHTCKEVRDAIKPIVLAVDDSPSILRTVSHILQDKYMVYTVAQPELVKDVLKKVTPDLFLLDVQMPNITGFELAPIIRQDVFHKDTPILFLTSEATRDNVIIALHHLKAADFIVKPIDEVTLREKIDLYMSNFIIQRRIRALIE